MSEQIDYYVKNHDAFLSPRVADAASRYCDHLLNSTDHVWTTNFAWAKDKPKHFMNPMSERYENLCLVHKIWESNPELWQNIVNDIQKIYPHWIPETREAMQFFVWTGGSRIEWHSDFKHGDPHDARVRSGAITIYLNRHWDIEWGGDFLYKNEKQEVQRVTPSYNRAVAIRNVSHRSTEIQTKRFRKCIQIFLKDIEVPLDNNADFC